MGAESGDGASHHHYAFRYEKVGMDLSFYSIN